MKNTGSNPRPALMERNRYPSPEVLIATLGNSYVIYEELVRVITSPEMGLNIDWRYYNDSKSWLCKATYGKKTIFWLSAWDDGTVRISFFFAQSKTEGVLGLDINEKLKHQILSAPAAGRLVPLIVELGYDTIDEILKISDYKKLMK